MTMSQRDRRALLALGVALAVAAVLRYGVPETTGNTSGGLATGASPAAIQLAQQRLARLRQIAATVPARDAVLKQAQTDLADRERGMLHADTAAQAQAGLLETARRIGKANQIDVRGGELGAPKTFGEYGLVYATVSFECHIEQLVNFLADLAREPELIVPSEERLVAGNVAKDKIMVVRMVLAGVVAKKLVPEKKGLAAF